MNVVLIGYRATGKSTVGKKLAERLGWRYLDTDAAVEAQAGTTLADLFERHGEPHFRKLEADVVRQAAALDRTVIAAGGGAVLDPKSAAALARNGHVVLLTASVEEIERRMNLDSSSVTRRPALTHFNPREEVERLLAMRTEPYRELCNRELDTTGQTVEQVAAQIAAQVKALPAFGRER